MRDISAAAMSYVTKTRGVEPIIIVEITWNSTPLRYGDKAYPDDDVEGRILQLNNLENVINVSKSGSSQSISITLDDTDGALKDIYNYTDIHKKAVHVYQWFTGIPYSDRFLIFEGVISSPIVWNEGDRTLGFDVISKLEDKEIGYSPEEGTYDFIPSELIGKAWPLPFGTCFKVPAIKLDPIPTGITKNSDGMADENIRDQIVEIAKKVDQMQELAKIYYRLALEAYTNAAVDEDGNITLEYVDEEFASLGDQYTAQANQLQVEIWNMQQDSANLSATYNAQKLAEELGLEIYDGDTFPQGSTFSAKLGNIHYRGYMARGTYNITSRSRDNNTVASSNYQQVDTEVADGQLAIERLGFLWNQPGLSFKMLANLPVRYIAAMLPCTVEGVYAKRNFKENTVMMPVPENYYNVTTESFGGVTATMITLVKPLSYYEDQGWQDDIYVDLVSPVGPNTVDILTWMIQTYTDLGIDASSFAEVETAVDPFPSNFCLLSRSNVISALSEIAYQARCAIWLKNGIFYLRYLPNEPDTVDTITTDDIIHGSFSIEHSSTEDIVTKKTGSYVISYDQEKPNKIILRHNVSKYGIQPEERDWFIYNHPNLVDLAMTFWLIRESNTWKIIKFRTPLHKLKLETFDAVTIQISHSHIGNVTGIVQAVSLDTDSLEIEFEIWLPVRLGEMTQYDFAFPIDDQTNIFPKTTDLPGGNGPGKNTNGQLIPNNGAEHKAINITFNRGPNREHIDFGNPNPGGQVDASVTLVTKIGPVANTNIPNVNNYAFRQYGVPVLDQEATTKPSTVPGKITEDSGGGKYKVDTYSKGLDGPTKKVLARSADTNKGFTIGEWVMVLTVVWKEDKDLKSERVLVPVSAKSVFPGKVTGKSGSTYNMSLYKDGLAGDATPVTGVRVLQIASSETIPNDTWLLVGQSKKDDGTEEFFMQPPIWLE